MIGATLVILLACGGASLGGPPPPVEIVAEPEWVEPVADPAGWSVPPTHYGAVHRLSDRQEWVAPERGRSWIYWRGVIQVLTPAGLERAGRLRWRYRADTERFRLHRIAVIRAGRIIDRTRSVELRVARRQRRANAGIYDDEVSVLGEVHDLRVGDRLEVAISWERRRPLYGGRFTGVRSLWSSQPVGLLRYRLLWPSHRALYVDLQGAIAPEKRTLGDYSEYVWTYRSVLGEALEDDLPSWYRAEPRVGLGEVATWTQVARAAWQGFAPLLAQAEGVGAVAAELAAGSEDPTERALAALRWMTGNIRYVAELDDVHGHIPHAPQTTLARRFGDCKDASLLLVAILDRLGVDARPALVDTDQRERIATLKPTLSAFDHVVVRARAGGRTLWLDPTRPQSPARLEALWWPTYGRALVLGRDTEGLVHIGEPPLRSHVEVTSTFANDRLSVKTRYLGGEAIDMRRILEGEGRQREAHDYLEYYRRLYDGLRLDEPMVVQDSPDRGELTTVERYAIPGLFGEGKLRYRPTFINAELQASDARRRYPMGVPHPTRIVETIVLRAPRPIRVCVKDARRRVSGPAFEWAATCNTSGRGRVHRFTYESTADHVPPELAPEHAESSKRARVSWYAKLKPPPKKRAAASDSIFDDGSPPRTALDIFNVVMVLLALWLFSQAALQLLLFAFGALVIRRGRYFAARRAAELVFRLLVILPLTWRQIRNSVGLYLATIEIDLGRLPAARQRLEALREGARHAVTKSTLRFADAELALAEGDWSGALSVVIDAFTRRADLPKTQRCWLYVARAEALLQLGHVGEAAAAVDDALGVRRLITWKRQHRGVRAAVLLATGREEDAERELEAIRRERPRDGVLLARIYRLWAVGLRLKGDEPGARVYEELASRTLAAVAPEHPLVRVEPERGAGVSG